MNDTIEQIHPPTRHEGAIMKTTTTPAPQDWGYALCEECGRAFDLLDADAANEWHHGHDCDPSLSTHEANVEVA